EGVPVLVEGPHRHRELQVSTCPGSVPDAQEAETKPEVRVVVHGIDLDGVGELRARRGEPPAPEVRTAQGLANGRFLRLEIARTLERDRCGVGVRTLEQPAALLIRVICLGAHVPPAWILN